MRNLALRKLTVKWNIEKHKVTTEDKEKDSYKSSYEQFFF